MRPTIRQGRFAKNIIDAAAIAKMKKGVRIINCARGGLIVEADLKNGLESGQVAGAPGISRLSP